MKQLQWDAPVAPVAPPPDTDEDGGSDAAAAEASVAPVAPPPDADEDAGSDAAGVSSGSWDMASNSPESLSASSHSSSL